MEIKLQTEVDVWDVPNIEVICVIYEVIMQCECEGPTKSIMQYTGATCVKRKCAICHKYKINVTADAKHQETEDDTR